MLILFLVSIILISGCIRLPQACKLDAKVCPDGTSVGRDPSSKNCEEFYPCPTTNQFNIHYSFGVGEKNVLDTKNNVYVKDMVCDPQKQYNIKLSEYERTIIYDAIFGNDLLNIKDNFTKYDYEATPLSTSTLKIEFDGKTKIIKWRADYYNNNDPDLKKFMSATTMIRKLISQKEMELNIEQPKCGYL